MRGADAAAKPVEHLEQRCLRDLKQADDLVAGQVSRRNDIDVQVAVSDIA